MTLVREGVERLVEAVLVFSRTTSDESNRLDGLPWLEPLPSRAEKYEFRDALGGRFGPDDDKSKTTKVICSPFSRDFKENS